MTIRMQRWVDSKFAWNVKIRPAHEEELSKLCIGPLMTYCTPNTEYSLWNCTWNLCTSFFDFALKSPISSTKERFFWTKLSNFNSSFSENC